MYYDLDDILAEEEKVSAVTNITATRLGFLDPASDEEDLVAATKVDMPIWLARALSAKHMVTLRPPTYLSDKFKDHLTAGPLALNLRDYSPFFYKAGLSVAQSVRSEAILDILRQTYSGERFNQIMDWAFNSCDEDITHFTKNLTHTEQRLFDSGFRTREQVGLWRGGDAKDKYYIASGLKRRRLEG
uniref:DNA replication complex GINS protein PSF3 N-terminal domain-containing protein n=1 Tax=Phaeomonas parva TaxID=124430 RepID=A0A6U4G7W6_9STRA